MFSAYKTEKKTFSKPALKILKKEWMKDFMF